MKSPTEVMILVYLASGKLTSASGIRYSLKNRKDYNTTIDRLISQGWIKRLGSGKKQDPFYLMLVTNQGVKQCPRCNGTGLVNEGEPVAFAAPQPATVSPET